MPHNENEPCHTESVDHTWASHHRPGDCFGTGGAEPTTDVGERRRPRVTKRLSAEPLRRAGEPKPLQGDGWCRDGFNEVSCVGDLDLTGLGLLSDGDGE